MCWGRGEVGDCGEDKDKEKKKKNGLGRADEEGRKSMAGVGNYTYLNLLDLDCKRQDWQGKHSS